MDKRILFGSLAAAVVISVAGGLALSASGGDADSGASTLDDDITLPSAGTFTEPGLGNDLVEGEKLPNVTVHDLAGNEVSTADLVGQPLVINVWATSCAPCKEEMPALARVHRDFGDRVRFVGLNQFPNTAEAIEFAADKGVRYELMSDDNGEFVTALGIHALPYTVFVAADGTIVAQKGIALDEAAIRAAVEEYLGG